MPDLSFEQELRAEGFTRIAGIDEAGRGPLAGPVSAAAVILPEEFEHAVLTDSKKLTEKRREALYEELATHPDIVWASHHVPVDAIDDLNILQATYLGMRESFGKLSPAAEIALIDGKPVTGFPAPHRAVIKGDSLSLSIAAASIIAKVERDRMMLAYDEEFPGYGFAKHKGYGTKAHRQAISELGPCPIHRRSFAPIAQMVGFTRAQGA